MQWNPELLAKYVAPGISQFTTAAIPTCQDRFPQAAYWPVNLFLNSVLRTPWPEGYRQIVLAFLRRTSHAFFSYHDARSLTLQYLEGNDPLNPRIGAYFNAVARWEVFAIEMTVIIDLFKWLNKDVGAFLKNDGSKEQRLYEVGNCVKHLPSCVRSGQCTADHSMPLWVDSGGIRTFSHSVAFGDACDVLMDFCILCDEMQDPLTFLRNTQAQRLNSQMVVSADAPANG